jgi:hypothetical protein
MTELHRKPDESTPAWLVRLQRMDPGPLPGYTRTALALSIGYARYLLRKAGTKGPAGPPTVGCVALPRGENKRRTGEQPC